MRHRSPQQPSAPQEPASRRPRHAPRSGARLARGLTALATGASVALVGLAVAGAGTAGATGPAATIPTLTVSGTYTVPNAGVTIDHLTFDYGTMQGTGKITIPAGGTVTIKAGEYGTITGGSRLVNQGTATIPASSQLYLGNNSVFENASKTTMASGSAFDANDSTSIELQNDKGATLTYGAASTTDQAVIQVPMQNLGSVAVTGGTLELQGGTPSTLTDTGSFAVSTGAILQTNAGSGEPQILGSGATETGAGTFKVSGYVSVPTVTTPPSVASLELDYGTIDGPGTLAVATGGTMSVVAGEYGTIDQGVRILNHGTTNFTEGSTLYFNNSSVFENAGKAAFSSGSDLANDGSTVELQNDKGATLSYGATSVSLKATVDVPMQNLGAVSVTGGTLDLEGGTPSTLTDTGSFAVSTGAVLQTDASTGLPQVLGSGATETGAGVFEVSGDVSIPSSATPPTVTNLEFDYGQIDGPGTIEVPKTSTMGVLSGEYGTLDDGVQVTNLGTLNVAAATLYFYTSALIVNSGTVELSSGGDLAGDSSAVELENKAAGTVSFTGQSSSQSATISALVDNLGTLSVGGGTLYLGALTNGGTGKVALTVSRANTPVLNVGNTATLGGKLALTNAAGYSPTSGTTFPIITAGTVVHTFASVTGTTGTTGTAYGVQYSPNEVTLLVGKAPKITSAATATFALKKAHTFKITATGSPLPTITETGTLPKGITFTAGTTAGTATLSGTPTVAGTSHITIKASNGVAPNASQAFTLTVS